MAQTLFSSQPQPAFLLDITFSGPSFDGVMEIGALSREIQGLKDAIELTVHALKRRSEIPFSVKDIEIHVEAFKKGSFQKRIRIWNKKAKEYTPLLSAATVILLLLDVIPSYTPTSSGTPSKEIVERLKNEVALELLQDKRFLMAAANIVADVQQDGDKASFASATNEAVEISPEESRIFVSLATPTSTPLVEERRTETLKVRINKVDLDASKRHIGFKVGGEGATVDGTFVSRPDIHDLTDLLGQWVEVDGEVEYGGGQPLHMDIENYSLLKQMLIPLDE